ncbi:MULTISPECIES: signal peptidase I [Thermodesulfobacterium]|jgi:signal peptidase I|uniref:Signal peptidase I n=1 Tax=Thermodesulfobacterium commune TaxID=1741 RepID=A0A117LCL3_9BACT|nr:signal peptidase I [Thermodesulfobacterium sp.]KUJ97828.1 MAG: Signal peptidase I [Thermodesulfobacterium sp. 37_54]KUK19270.1 MAG: Signal peptidase I [Thermodesulfobacterium commune]KUK38571.1 MAG: Signal peptidase I [Thermodesulfobacterium commune]MBZ4681958.1 signal peptidase [Thermodesulfobacterium sp.]MDK2861130.1 signal peptidase [Thermodesulfobacterium sp.]
MEPNKNKVLDWIKSLVIALILALFIRTFVVQAYKIPSGSMIPTLLIGDYLLVNKLSFGIKHPIKDGFLYFRELPKRQEVVVFTYPLDKKLDFIKRVIGLPGDTVQIVNKKVYVNGQLLYEPYVQFTDPEVYPREVSPRDNLGPIKVPPGKIFVLGDNRDQSYDSRFWGFVPIEYLKGRALIIYFSWDSEHFKIRLDRIGRLIK